MTKATRHTTVASLSMEDILKEIKKITITSNCPKGCIRIQNFYWDPKTNEIVIQLEDE